jgi:hypothetical protein
VKAKIICTGYTKDLVFVNRTPASLTVNAATVLSDIRNHALHTQEIQGLDPEFDLHKNFLELLSPSCHFLELRPRAVDLVKKLYLPLQEDNDSNSIQSIYDWLLSIAELKGSSKALDISLLSFCMTLLYVTGSSSASLEKSLDLYNTALQKLRADIEDPTAKFRRETLAAILLISTTEVSNPAHLEWMVFLSYNVSSSSLVP